MGKLYFDRDNLPKLQEVIEQLESCQVNFNSFNFLWFNKEFISTHFQQLYKYVQNDTKDVSSQIRMIEVNILKILSHMDSYKIKQCKDLYYRTETILKSIPMSGNVVKFNVPFLEVVAILHGLFLKFWNISSFQLQITFFIFSECSGRLEFHNGEKGKARVEFSDAYDNYEISQSTRKNICKKFLIEKLDEPRETFLDNSE